MVMRDIRNFYRVPDERLHLVYNGVDLARFSPGRVRGRSGPRPGRPTAWPRTRRASWSIAHNFRLKGVRELVEAAARLDRGQQWRVIVIGKAAAKPYLELAEELGCADRFLFPGAVPDVVPAYAACRRLRSADVVRPVQPGGARGAGVRAAGHHNAIQRRRAN